MDNVRQAEKSLLKTRNTLFDELIKNVENYAELKNLIINMLYYGKKISYSLSNSVIELGVVLGIFAEKEYMTAISNVIFETHLYDYTVNYKSCYEKRTKEKNYTCEIKEGD